MKRLLFLLFFLPIFAIGQNQVPPSTKSRGDYDQTLRARDTLFTDYHFVYRDTVIPVLDISYHEFSSDGNSWHKPWVEGDTYIRISNDVKNTWKVLSIMALLDTTGGGGECLWARDANGGIYNYRNDYDVHVMNSLEVEDSINTNNFYFLDGDSLKITWLNATDGTTGDILQNINGVAYWIPITSVFDSAGFYDAQNANIGGVGVWNNTSENVFYFRGIDGDDACITALLDAATNRIVVAFDPTCLSLTAGIGLSGGGTFDASGNVIVNLSIPELTTATSYDSTDWFAMYDVSIGAHRKVNIQAITGGTPNSDSVFWIAANDGSIDTVFNNTALFFEEGDTTINIEVSGDSVIFTVNGCPVPHGGTAGQVLVKLSDADCDLAWVDFCDLVEVCDTLDVLADMCDYAELEFSNLSPQVGHIKLDYLTSSVAVVGDYVIDWYMDGTLRFTSATADAGITNYIAHPFSGTLGLPVPGGVYTPVIRWVEVNGIRYTSQYDEPGTYDPSLIDCLDDVYAEDYTCDNGGVYGNYSHSVSYNYVTASIYETATRELTMDLDVSTDYIPWSFTANSVYDVLSIYYVHNGVETLVEEWTVGDGVAGALNPFDIGNHHIGQSSFYKIADFRPYSIVAGDKVKFVITPSLSITDWEIRWKCLDDIRDVAGNLVDPCEPLSNDWQTIDQTQTLTISWDAVNSRYVLPIDAVSAQVTNDITKYTYDMYDRSGGSMWSTQTSAFVYWSKTHYMFANFNTTYSWTYKSTYDTGCHSFADNITYSKVGNTLTFSAISSTDYTYLKNMFTVVLSNAAIADYSADGTNIKHYKLADIYGASYLTCPTDPSGLVATFPAIYTAYDLSNVVYDDVNKTITITRFAQTNEMPQLDADNGWEAIEYWDVAQPAITVADFTYTFKHGNLGFRVGTWTTTGYVAQTQVTGYNKVVPRYLTWGSTGEHVEVQDLCDEPTYYFTASTTVPWHVFYQSWYRLTITDYDLADHTVANANFRLESYLNADGTYTATPRKIFERKTGQPDVWYPVTWYP